MLPSTHDGVDLDHAPARKLGNADGASVVMAGFAEHINQQRRAAIHHLGNEGEAG
ncbi:MAG TPA: hypothetical protein VGU01_05495 [Sphingomicrobium sp.]|nr:hypothetical protein [Sphingomicrobium sp.]